MEDIDLKDKLNILKRHFLTWDEVARAIGVNNSSVFRWLKPKGRVGLTKHQDVIDRLVNELLRER